MLSAARRRDVNPDLKIVLLLSLENKKTFGNNLSIYLAKKKEGYVRVRRFAMLLTSEPCFLIFMDMKV